MACELSQTVQRMPSTYGLHSDVHQPNTFGSYSGAPPHTETLTVCACTVVVGKALVVGTLVVEGKTEAVDVEVVVLCPIPTADFTPVLDDELSVKMRARAMAPAITIPVMAISVMCVPVSLDVLGSAMAKTLGLSSFKGEVPPHAGILWSASCASAAKGGGNHARRILRVSITSGHDEAKILPHCWLCHYLILQSGVQECPCRLGR